MNTLLVWEHAGMKYHVKVRPDAYGAEIYACPVSNKQHPGWYPNYKQVSIQSAAVKTSYYWTAKTGRQDVVHVVWWHGADNWAYELFTDKSWKDRDFGRSHTLIDAHTLGIEKELVTPAPEEKKS